MNRQPIIYHQTDPRWKALPYRIKGETATVGGSGCGPSCAAMVITSMTGEVFTPKDACDWSVAHGYKALNAGTYYSYFVPQFKAFGIDCKQLLGSSLHNNPTHAIHAQVKDYLAQGYYAIALMGPGLWTSGGHYILLWDWDDKVRINDPASKKAARLNGDPELFKKQVKQYWLVDARDYNEGVEEMFTYDMFKEYMDKYRAELAAMAEPDWAKNTGEWQDAIKAKITDGARPQDFASRAEIAAMIMRYQEEE